VPSNVTFITTKVGDSGRWNVSVGMESGCGSDGVELRARHVV